jgi:polysaccharide export outer membrane protein
MCPSLRYPVLAASLLGLFVFTGCATVGPAEPVLEIPMVPKELDKQPLAEYVIEPPDVLQIDALRLVPRGPYRIETFDAVILRVTNTFPDEPLDGPFLVDADGTIDLGATYGGKIKIADLTPDEARALVVKRLAEHIKGHKVVLAVSPSRALQQVRGQHLVRPDGTVGLGVYGSVRVVGLTIAEAKLAIEQKLADQFLRPEVSVEVIGFNSKVYYVIMDGAGMGEQVIRLPVTGNETVLDAIAQVYGLLPVSDKREIFVARPSPCDEAGDQVMPVDWIGLCMRGRTVTNYQLLPGDRVYINSDKLVEFDTRLARLLSPIERLFGVSLLGYTSVRTISGKPMPGFGN